MIITFLGTSGSTPTKNRNLPSVAINYNGEVLLFDCGEGTQRQALINSVNIAKIDKIFISHIHGDHTIGLAGLIRTMALNNREKPLYIFVPKEAEKNILELLNFDKISFKYKIIIEEIKSGVIFKGKDYKIKAFKLKHSTITYGFIFQENDKVRFLKDKCKKLGIKGLMFKELKEKGKIKINNKIIKLNEVTYNVTSKKIVYATDTRPCISTINAATNADLLIHDATYDNNMKTFAVERMHSTASEAATIAKKAKCKKLALFHISSRYKDIDILKNEATIIFKNSFVPNDGMKIEI
ncbi:MAG: ribonuclease Z [Candidatus Micrarchaeia archaeon]